jgi:hypothetical protein
MGKEADRHVQADPPLGGGLYFLTNLRFFDRLRLRGDRAGSLTDSGLAVMSLHPGVALLKSTSRRIRLCQVGTSNSSLRAKRSNPENGRNASCSGLPRRLRLLAMTANRGAQSERVGKISNHGRTH